MAVNLLVDSGWQKMNVVSTQNQIILHFFHLDFRDRIST